MKKEFIPTYKVKSIFEVDFLKIKEQGYKICEK